MLIEAAGDISLEASAIENDIVLTHAVVSQSTVHARMATWICQCARRIRHKRAQHAIAGFELDGQDCNECSAGFFKGSKGTEACAACECPAGNTMTCDSIQGSTCTQCPAGHFKATGASGFPGLSESCTPCGVGEYQPNTGATQCLEALTSLGFSPPRLREPSDSSVPRAMVVHHNMMHRVSTPAGALFVPMVNLIEWCMHSLWREYAYQKMECRTCPDGHECSAGLKHCPTGTYSNDPLQSCAICPLGTMTFGTGSAQCSTCPVGKFVVNNECTPCQLEWSRLM